MKLITLTVLTLGLGVAHASTGKLYGKAFTTPRGGAMMLNEAIDTLKSSKDKRKKLKNVVIQGEVASVCKKKGCWISLKTEKSALANTCDEALKSASNQKEVRVVFSGHRIAVPRDLKGSVIVAGTMRKKKLSKFQRRHYLKDAGCSTAQIKSVKGPMYKYQIKAKSLQTL